ncbi:Hypothetical protein A7982_03739 [Minicystis rosea]|nr:Hypothetical protein A7982_03739 [Minicystis rosea]
MSHRLDEHRAFIDRIDALMRLREDARARIRILARERWQGRGLAMTDVPIVVDEVEKNAGSRPRTALDARGDETHRHHRYRATRPSEKSTP